MNNTEMKDYENTSRNTEFVPRMRVAKECYQMIHESDPDSRISLRYIRQLIKNEKITVHKVGTHKLVDYDELINYLKRPQ